MIAQVTAIAFRPSILLLAAPLILSSSIVFWKANQDNNLLNLRNKPAQPETAHQPPNRAKLDNLRNARHLFGKSEQKQTQPKHTKVIPKTRLKLTLSGTFTHSEDSKASAIITANNKSQRYRIGERVPGGAELVSIHKETVIFQRNGRQEQLTFAHKKNQPKSATVSNHKKLAQTWTPDHL